MAKKLSMGSLMLTKNGYSTTYQLSLTITLLPPLMISAKANFLNISTNAKL